MNHSNFIKNISTSEAIYIIGPLYSKTELFEKTPTIFVDGGSRFMPKSRSINNAICIGDGDSFNGKLDIVLPEEKDFSDLQFALSLLHKNIKEIHLRGFLGGRRDHEIINLGEIYEVVKNKLTNTKVYLDDEIILLPKGFNAVDIDQTFSLVCFESSDIKVIGECKYQLRESTVLAPMSSQGLSNIGYGIITIESNNPIFLYKSQE